MTERTPFRGYLIEKRDSAFVFADTGEAVADTWRDRPCGFCGRHDTPEGHDACLGTIPGAVNACCGHGDTRAAYVQYPDRTTIRGDAVWVHLGLRSVTGEAQA